MMRFARPRPRRRPSLTPMIDVVFLLLVFFMLAARFGQPQGIPLTLSGSGGDYTGPPRLVEVLSDGQRLNGAAVGPDALLTGLSELTEDEGDVIVLRARDKASLQRLVEVMDGLRAAGFSNLALVE